MDPVASRDRFPEVADTTVRGVVRVAGADPLTQVVLHSGNVGPDVGILGALRAELGSLDGVEVSVTGAAVPNQPPPPPRAIRARSYEIMAVSGMPAHAGVLVRRGESLWLYGMRDTLELADPVPPSVTELVGARVFIAGPIHDGKLRVQAYGVVKTH